MIFGALILGVMSGLACCALALVSGASILAAIQVYMVGSLGTAIGVLAFRAAWCFAARTLETGLRRAEQRTQTE